MDVPTDRVSMTLIVATGLLALLGLLLAFRVPLESRGFTGYLLPAALVVGAVAIVVLTWVGLDRMD